MAESQWKKQQRDRTVHAPEQHAIITAALDLLLLPQQHLPDEKQVWRPWVHAACDRVRIRERQRHIEAHREQKHGESTRSKQLSNQYMVVGQAAQQRQSVSG